MTPRAAIVRLLYYPDDLLVRREAEALHEAGFEVDVFCLRNTGERAEDTIAGVQVHRLPLKREKRGAARNLLEYGVFFWLAAWALLVEHVRGPFTVIQVNTLPDFLVFATLFPKLLGAKVTLMMYEPMPELWATKFSSPWPSRVLRMIAQWAVRYADTTITVTEPLKQTLVAHGARADKIAVVLNAPDPRWFGPSSASMISKPAGTFTLICHGAIEERYGHDTMVEAVSRLRDRLPGLRLVITGDGSFREEFLALVKRKRLEDRIHYLGYVSLAELLEELSRADVGLVAQKASAYSHLVHTGKMYDYLALRKPVIASRLQAVNAYFDEQSLAYFAAGDADDLARVILELAQNPAHLQILVEHSQSLYAHYQWSEQKEHYLAVYRRWLTPNLTSRTHVVAQES